MKRIIIFFSVFLMHFVSMSAQDIRHWLINENIIGLHILD